MTKDCSHENIGKPIGQAMIEAGYSKSTAKTAQRVTESKSWNKLMEKYFDEDKDAQIHEMLFSAKIM